jgi:hypothetical protein
MQEKSDFAFVPHRGGWLEKKKRNRNEKESRIYMHFLGDRDGKDREQGVRRRG